jgi:thiamine monophosphate kinase
MKDTKPILSHATSFATLFSSGLPRIGHIPHTIYPSNSMKKSLKPIGELELIEQIRRDFSPSHSKTVALGIGDDCAILRPPAGHEVLVTTDFTLENQHFRRDLHPPESVGHRCLARGLSDLAAMGATPIAAFLSLALPADLMAKNSGQQWIARFFNGLRALADIYSVPLAGGDTSESPSGLVLADIILIGSAPKGKALRRSTVRPGDTLYVTGQLGGAAAELAAILKRNKRITRSRASIPAKPSCGAIWPRPASTSATASRPTSPISAEPPTSAPKSSRPSSRFIHWP